MAKDTNATFRVGVRRKRSGKGMHWIQCEAGKSFQAAIDKAQEVLSTAAFPDLYDGIVVQVNKQGVWVDDDKTNTPKARE